MSEPLDLSLNNLANIGSKAGIWIRLSEEPVFDMFPCRTSEMLGHMMALSWLLNVQIA